MKRGAILLAGGALVSIVVVLGAVGIQGQAVVALANPSGASTSAGASLAPIASASVAASTEPTASVSVAASAEPTASATFARPFRLILHSGSRTPMTDAQAIAACDKTIADLAANGGAEIFDYTSNDNADPLRVVYP